MAEKKGALAPSEPPPSYESSEATAAATASSPATRNGPPPRPGAIPLLPLSLPALHLLRGERVVLASASPRRKQLLAQLGLTSLSIVPSNFAEDLSPSLSPFEYVLQTASAKALDVYEREVKNESAREPALLIAADTIVISHAGRILGKPAGVENHVAMLKELRDGGDGWHKVCTAVVVMAPLEEAVHPGYAMETRVEETSVKFDSSVTDDLIMSYVRTREGVDKAGGYGIQGIGSILIERIDGTFDNVVGLPLRAILQLIEKVLGPHDPLEDGAERLDGPESGDSD